MVFVSQDVLLAAPFAIVSVLFFGGFLASSTMQKTFEISDQVRACKRYHDSTHCINNSCGRYWVKMISSTLTAAYLACLTLFLAELLQSARKGHSTCVGRFFIKTIEQRIDHHVLSGSHDRWVLFVGRYLESLSGFITTSVKQGIFVRFIGTR